MSPENKTPETSAIVEVDPQTNALAETKTGETDELRRETTALIEAIRTRAQAEMQGASEITRDAYLNAVRQAREAVEHNQLFDPDEIERSMEVIQEEAEKNWNYVVNEIQSLGNRLADAAKAAWDTLMDDQPK